MSRIIFIDTLFVVALVNQRDQYHERAEALATSYEGAHFLITDAVILEIGNSLSRNFKDQAIQVIENLLSSDDVEVVHMTAELFDQAFSLFKTHTDKSWGLVDCMSFLVMRRAGAQDALTFDHNFVQAGFKALLRDLV